MLARFLQTGDPSHKFSSSLEEIAIPALKSGAQFLVTPGGIGTARLQNLEQRCAFWQAVGEKVPV
jgi:hypothetical protein